MNRCVFCGSLVVLSGWGWRCEVRECRGSASDLGPMGLLERTGRVYEDVAFPASTFPWRTRCPEGLLFVPWRGEERV